MNVPCHKQWFVCVMLGDITRHQLRAGAMNKVGGTKVKRDNDKIGQKKKINKCVLSMKPITDEVVIGKGIQSN